MTKYTAESLEDIANAFDTYASDQLAMITRYTTKREKRDAYIRAETWKSAASDLRDIQIVPKS